MNNRRETIQLLETERSEGVSLPPFSIIIPIHNESAILSDCLGRLVKEFGALNSPYELILCENGSTDNTFDLAGQFQRTHPQVRLERLETANYGLALKHAIALSREEFAVIFNIDFWNTEFAREALHRLTDADLVIGSKTLAGSVDQRPWFRRVITRNFNAFLHLFFDFRGTDTHGMKAFRTKPLRDILDVCVTDHFIFDTELVLRAQRKKIRITEIPVHVREVRQPGYLSLVRRTPEVIWNLTKLWFTLRQNP